MDKFEVRTSKGAALELGCKQIRQYDVIYWLMQGRRSSKVDLEVQDKYCRRAWQCGQRGQRLQEKWKGPFPTRGPINRKVQVRLSFGPFAVMTTTRNPTVEAATFDDKEVDDGPLYLRLLYNDMTFAKIQLLIVTRMERLSV